MFARSFTRLPVLRVHARFNSSAGPSYQHILSTRPNPAVALIQLHRPKALNALSGPLFAELNAAVVAAEADAAVGAIVITGSERAFAAGADIKEMQDLTFAEAYRTDFIECWAHLARARKPLIAAVSGYALGGGCELALACDIVLAAPSAVFGQPEIALGVIPGGGGTQRLARLVGKPRAMELILTGRTFSAAEAERWGVVARVVDGRPVLDEALDMAKLIAGKGRLAVAAAKETVNAAFELPLAEGVRFERRVFHSLFGTPDQKEGMAAFIEKRKPNFEHTKA